MKCEWQKGGLDSIGKYCNPLKFNILLSLLTISVQALIHIQTDID